uniref:Adenylate kinase 5ic n=1 Tax=Rhizophora mucronata TaxID=61149 RepID=A0A2P2KH23_RHIMU
MPCFLISLGHFNYLALLISFILRSPYFGIF